ncbi:SAF domain-containing protein [Clostridium cochlearium]|uniref:SAF domain-containing protein n=1 Tax=Clostridium cochlearium TaxID=1494 RepID=UPI001805D55D|nr:SAF domain-containing protein [Clostridium cochlearium]NMA58635.1 hypothetical protein [Clostridium cochlearium]
MHDKKKTIKIVATTSAFWLCLSIGGLYLRENDYISIPGVKAASQKVNILKVSRNITVGEKIRETDLKLVKETVNNVVSNCYTNEKLVVGKIAQRNLYKNEQIKKEDVLEKDLKDNKLRPCTMAVKLSNLNDITIKKGDFIDVVLNYKKNGIKPDIVVPKAIVKSVLDAKGEPITYEKSTENKQIPAYITFMCSLQDSLLVEDAKKQGTLGYYVYIDNTDETSKRTYIPSWEKQKDEKQK